MARSVSGKAPPPDQCMCRVKPHTGHVATLVSGSMTRNEVQPLVLQ